MLTKRQVKILEILRQHSEGITSDEIARLCGVSSKTVRTDIKTMGTEIDAAIATIEASTRSGFHLHIYDEKEFQALMQKDHTDAINGTNRNAYILHRLMMGLMMEQPIKQQDLADELFISLSTFKTSMKEIKAILRPYKLTIVNHKNQGMLINGKEAQIRRVLYDTLFAQADARTQVYEKIQQKLDTAALRHIIIHVTSSYDMVLTDNSLKHLLDDLVIALVRANQGNNVVFMLQESKEIEKKVEFTIASAIFEEIYQNLHIDVMTSEIYYLAQHLITSKKYTPSPNVASEHVKKLIQEMLDCVQNIVGIDFHDDKVLKQGLQTHLESVIPRIRLHVHIKNEVLDVVKNEYPLAFQIGVIASKVIEKEEGLPVNEDEISFIAVHFGAAITRSHSEESRLRRQVLVVCGSGMGTAVLLRARLEEYFKESLHVTQILPGYSLKNMNLDHIDLIVSTLDAKHLPKLSDKDKNKLVVVKNFLDDAEIDQIRQHLFQSKKISLLSVEKFFHRECFFTGKNYHNKEQILHFMTKQLENLGLMDAKTSKSVLEREAASPTEIGNLVAIPHPMENSTAISSISVLVLDRPIVWVDHHVQVVFLISIAKEEFYLWEPIFLKLFNYLVKENGVKQILDHPDYDSFIYNFEQSF